MKPLEIHTDADILLCRSGAEPELVDELIVRHQIQGQRVASGMVQLTHGTLPAKALVFERQRLPGAVWFPLRQGERLPSSAADHWQRWASEPMPWALHGWAIEEEAGLESRAAGVAQEFIRLGERTIPGLMKWSRKPEKLFAASKGMIIQCVLTPEGVWVSMAPTVALTANIPGGRYRMRMDIDAPSRSYLKVEEALSRMGLEPRIGERVVDLGAAPGGWTYAFAKRGCPVVAVDNGPLRLPPDVMARVDHRRADGMTFQLSSADAPVDWLIGDMLIPPGKAFALLKYWIGEKRARRIVLNIKLPQEKPVPVLAPIWDWLDAHGDFQVRQLYHDRREITVFGAVWGL